MEGTGDIVSTTILLWHTGVSVHERAGRGTEYTIRPTLPPKLAPLKAGTLTTFLPLPLSSSTTSPCPPCTAAVSRLWLFCIACFSKWKQREEKKGNKGVAKGELTLVQRLGKCKLLIQKSMLQRLLATDAAKSDGSALPGPSDGLSLKRVAEVFGLPFCGDLKRAHATPNRVTAGTDYHLTTFITQVTTGALPTGAWCNTLPSSKTSKTSGW